MTCQSTASHYVGEGDGTFRLTLILGEMCLSGGHEVMNFARALPFSQVVGFSNLTFLLLSCFEILIYFFFFSMISVSYLTCLELSHKRRYMHQIVALLGWVINYAMNPSMTRTPDSVIRGRGSESLRQRES